MNTLQWTKEKEENSLNDQTKGGNEYLLSMTFWSLTNEKFDALRTKAKEKVKELSILQKKLLK